VGRVESDAEKKGALCGLLNEAASLGSNPLGEILTIVEDFFPVSV
jgi:hypothetical protein